MLTCGLKCVFLLLTVFVSFNSIQDVCILFNLIIILLMLFNTYMFQVGLVAILLEQFRALLMLSALYLTFSIILHSWLVVYTSIISPKYTCMKTCVSELLKESC